MRHSIVDGPPAAMSHSRDTMSIFQTQLLFCRPRFWRCVGDRVRSAPAPPLDAGTVYFRPVASWIQDSVRPCSSVRARSDFFRVAVQLCTGLIPCASSFTGCYWSICECLCGPSSQRFILPSPPPQSPEIFGEVPFNITSVVDVEMDSSLISVCGV